MVSLAEKKRGFKVKGERFASYPPATPAFS